MKANEAQEGSDWLLARVGKFTASRAGALMAMTKSGPSTSRQELITTLAVERLTGRPVETYQNSAMLRGIELEGEARDAYSFQTGNAVEECGFIEHAALPMVGASPDGLIQTRGVLEIKCPTSMNKHIDAIRSEAHAKEYKWQLQHQLWVTGRDWVDMVSYHPEFPEHLQLAILRVGRDSDMICDLIRATAVAEKEVQALLKELS